MTIFEQQFIHGHFLALEKIISSDSSEYPGSFSHIVQEPARDKWFGQVKSFDSPASSRRIGPTSDMEFGKGIRFQMAIH